MFVWTTSGGRIYIFALLEEEDVEIARKDGFLVYDDLDFNCTNFLILKIIGGKTGELSVIQGMKEEKAAEVEMDSMYYNLIESNYGKSCNFKVK